MSVPIYSDDNIFAKTLRGEIPKDYFYEDDYSVVFEDIHPQAKVHLLILPKGKYTDIQDLLENATDAERIGFFDAIKIAAEKAGINETGYRLIFNCRKDSNQDVPHLHAHMIGGEDLGPLQNRK